MKCKKLLAFALTAALFVSACTNVFAAANVSATDAAATAPQTTVSQPAEPETDEAAQEVVVTEDETVTVQEQQVQANEDATSGTCGDSLNWNYNTSTGVLTISGSGAMTSHPWDGYKNSIEQVKFSGNVTSICDDAFEDCKNIERITIPASIETIGGGAFYQCANLESVTFSSGSKLEKINTSYDYWRNDRYHGAFENCANLERIVIPDSVTFMDGEAFNGCTNLESVTLGKNIETINSLTFDNCVNLETVKIGANTKKIAQTAFKNCSSINTINIPDHVESVGSSAFEGCTSLVSVTFGNSMKTIGDYVFDGCKKLSSVNLGKSVEQIGDSVFNNCDSLKSITIPASVTTMGSTFYGLTSIKNITFASGSKLEEINTSYDYWRNDRYHGAFEGCTGLEKIVIPDSVTSIGRETFLDCDNLKTVVLGKNIETVSYLTFDGCSSLTMVTIGSNTINIGEAAFRNCKALKTITVPDNVKTIYQYAFQGCTSLSTVKLGKSLETINDYVFDGCSSLQNITIPSSVTTMGNAFFGLENLKSVIFATNSKLTVINTNYEYWRSNKYEGAFEGCVSLESIVLPDTLSKIDTDTFEGCTSLKTVTIGKHITDIGNSAFYNCTSLTEIVIPKAVNSIQEYAFYNCSALTTVKYTGTQARWNTLKNDGISTDGNSYLLNVPNIVYNYSPLASVAVKTNPTKTAYTVGETFSSAGLKLLATYENGTTKEITSGFTCSPSGKLNTVGQQTITVTYQGKTTSFSVTVNPKTMSSITIKTLPTKKTYTVGEKFAPTGMTVKVNYTDGTNKVISSGYTYTPTGAMNTAGQQTIAVAYKENGVTKGTGFKVTVNPASKTMSSITIKTLPTKKTYTVGEKFAPAGMTIKVNYTDGTSKVISSGYTYTPTGAMNTAGQQTIAVSYKENGVTKGTGFKVTVNPKTMSSITIKTLPTKKTYTVGEKFDPTGMTVKVNYTDGTNKVISSGYTYTPTGAMNTAGQQTIAVSYKENGVTKGTGFKVTVNAKTLSSITIKKLPTKMTYSVGEKFVPTGMIVKLNYADGTNSELTSGYTYTPTGVFTVAGSQAVNVSYQGKNTGFRVTVNSKSVKSIRVSQNPTRTYYTVGDTLDTAGMKLKVTYSDDSTAEIASGFVCTPTQMTAYGVQWITVKYGGTATAFPVHVKKVKSILVSQKPTKQTYVVGETLNTSGLKVNVTYEDNTSCVISKGFVCTPTSLTAEGIQWITVKHGGTATAFPVKVTPSSKTVSAIAIQKKPTKQSYSVGESFNSSGMTVKVTYTDNTTVSLTGGFTCTPTGKFTAKGQQKIVVSYRGKSTGFYVTVA